MTEAGEILRSHLTPALGQIDRAVQALRGNAETLTGRIRLGTPPSFHTRMVPLCVSTFLHPSPGSTVTDDALRAELLARTIAPTIGRTTRRQRVCVNG